MPLKRCLQKYASVSPCITERNIRNCDFELNFELKEPSKTSFLNWKYGKMPQPTHISGPITLTRHRLKNDRGSFDVYIFGEFHGQDSTCENWNEFMEENDPVGLINTHSMSIIDFIHQIIDNTPVFLDVFVEQVRRTELWRKKSKEWFETRAKSKALIVQLRDSLEEYIPKKKEKGFTRILQNVRIHEIDVRNFAPVQHFTYFENISLTELETSEELRHEFIEQLKSLVLWQHKDIREFIHKFYLENSIIGKEYNKLTKKRQIEILTIFVDIFVDEVIKKNEFADVENALNEYYTERVNDEWQSFFKLYSFFKLNTTGLFGLYMDMYFVTRFFKGFDTTTDPKFPYNSIIYVGNFHAENYRRIFDKLGFTNENLALNYDSFFTDLLLTEEDCVDIKERYFIACEKRGDENSPYKIFPKRCLQLNTKKAYPFFGVYACEQAQDEDDEDSSSDTSSITSSSNTSTDEDE